jgi:hypothetical protein
MCQGQVERCFTKRTKPGKVSIKVDSKYSNKELGELLILCAIIFVFLTILQIPDLISCLKYGLISGLFYALGMCVKYGR